MLGNKVVIMALKTNEKVKMCFKIQSFNVQLIESGSLRKHF